LGRLRLRQPDAGPGHLVRLPGGRDLLPGALFHGCFVDQLPPQRQVRLRRARHRARVPPVAAGAAALAAIRRLGTQAPAGRCADLGLRNGLRSMNRAAYLFLAGGLGFASMVGCSRPAPEQPRLSPEDDAAWKRIVAALHQLSDEYSEALEIEDAETGRRRREQLARVLDDSSAVAAQIGGPTGL